MLNIFWRPLLQKYSFFMTCQNLLVNSHYRLDKNIAVQKFITDLPHISEK